MEIQLKEQGNKGSFIALEDSKKAGEMTHVFAGEKRFIIDHTEVDSTFSGKGVGLKLVMAAVDYARKEGYQILPLCPFAKSVFDKRPEIGDVLS